MQGVYKNKFTFAPQSKQMNYDFNKESAGSNCFNDRRAFISCGNSQKNSQQIEESEAAIVQAPAFNADSAYAYIAAQVQFGPRVPNTEAHRRCGDYLAAQLEKFGAKVYNQHADLVAYNGIILKSRNIIGLTSRKTKSE